MSHDEQNIAISYYVEEIEKQETEKLNIEEFMAEIENELDDELTIPKMIKPYCIKA